VATFASILALSTDPANSGSQTTGGATAAISVNPGAPTQRRIIAINANQDVNIRFGNSSVAAIATDFRIPQNQTFTFDTGQENSYFSLYNGSGLTVTYWWAYLNKL